AAGLGPYKLTPGPETALWFEFYPAAFGTSGFAANVGLFGRFDYGFGAATTVASSSASSRAPAIQPVHRSILRLALSGTAFCTRMSPICSRPLGLSTRAMSRRPAILSGKRFSTPLEITTSAHASGAGSI